MNVKQERDLEVEPEKRKENIKSEPQSYSSSAKREYSASDRSPKRSKSDEISILEEFIEVKYENQTKVEGYEHNTDELQIIEQYGLPSSFTQGASGTKSSKPGKKKYWCNLCECELTSDVAKNAHIVGVKHKKGMSIHKQKASDLGQGYKGRGPEGGMASKKKIPVRLYRKIEESNEPVMGLDFITEYIAVSNQEMEPHYECSLCPGTKGIANGMFSHLTGIKHRQAFIEYENPGDPEFVGWTQKECHTYAKENMENDFVEEKLHTIESDADYPWPKGFEPWALENEGADVAPPTAKENLGKFRDMIQKKRKEILPHPSELTAPKDNQEYEQMLIFYTELMDKVTDYVGGEKGKKLKALHNNHVNLIRTKKELPILFSEMLKKEA